MGKKIYAVVLNYNTSQDCKKCISYLKAQSYSDLHIVVVDNNSSDSDREILLKICDELKLKILLNTHNKGYSAGNNIGLKYAMENGADWCLIINPDVELRDTDYINKVVCQLDTFNGAAIVATNVVLPDGTRQNPMRLRSFAEELFWPIEIIRHHLPNWDHYLGKDISGYCDIVHGSCFFIKSEYLISANFLDERVFLYCEEEILSKRIIRSGRKIYYLNECTAYHEHYAKEKGKRKKRMHQYIKSRWYYYSQYCEYNLLQLLLLRFSLWTWKIYWTLRRD